MVVLGTDPGLEVTGWCLLDSRRHVLGCGDVKSSARLPDPERHVQIEAGLVEVFAWASASGFAPDVASIEQYVYQGRRSHNPNTFRLSRLVGVLEAKFRDLGLRVTGPTRGQALVAVGLLSNSPDRLLRTALARLARGAQPETKIPTNEHQRAAFAAAWWAAQRVRA